MGEEPKDYGTFIEILANCESGPNSLERKSDEEVQRLKQSTQYI